MVKEIHIKDVWHLCNVFYDAWLDETPIKLWLKESHRKTLEELLEESQAKDMSVDHVDWEFTGA